jgi:hypothetical protein
VASVDINSTGSSVLQVLLSNHKGQFAPATIDTPVGGTVTSIAVGNFNKDKYLDVIVTCYTPYSSYGDNWIDVYLGKGDGTFTQWGGGHVGGTPHAVAVGDFNSDGKLDAVATCDGETDVLLGDGTGRFTSVQNVAPGGLAVAVGDLNGDGKLDIVSSGWTALGNGDGTFRAAQSFANSGTLGSIALADFNGDGRLDMVASSNVLWPGTYTLLGNGDGTFGPEQQVGAQAEAVAVADFNGDGRLDIVSVDYFSGSTSVELGNGDGTFQTPIDFAFGGWCVAVADFNGDGYPDLVIGGLVYFNDKHW